MKFAFYLITVLTLVCVSGCNYFIPSPPCPPPPSAKVPLTPTYSCNSATIPIILPDDQEKMALVDLVDLALQNSNRTRASWYRAKQAAADVGVARGAYLPPLTFSGSYLGERILAAAQNNGVLGTTQNFYGPSLSTNYLIYDFGGRDAALAQATYALYELNWTFNWDVQTVMIDVITQYYAYLNAIGILEADIATVEDNMKSVEAATALRSHGARGLADELQARTHLVQYELILESDRGKLNVARANLASALNIPPDFPVKVVDVPTVLPVEMICKDMGLLLDVAKHNRADLYALRENVLVNRAKIQSAVSNFLPDLTTATAGGYQWINGQGPEKVWSVGFNLNFNVFNSFADINAIEKAKAFWLEAQADLDEGERLAFLSVLTDYFNFMASTTVLKYSYEYIDVATKNYEVAFAQYTMGITTIIDLMTAIDLLDNARKQLVNAKISWLTSLATLAYDTGGLTIDSITDYQHVRATLVECFEGDELYEEPCDE